MNENSVAALRFCLEEIISNQNTCIEKQRFNIEELEKRVTILTEELNANQLEICKLIKNK
jgi:hypothetical protein